MTWTLQESTARAGARTSAFPPRPHFHSAMGTVKLLGGSRELGELDGERAGGDYAASLMPQTSCHAWKARARSAR